MLATTITESSLRAIAELLTSLRTRLGPALRVAAEGEVLAVAEELKRNIIEEFRAGTDSAGKSHDKTGYTVGTFHVEPHPMGAFVVLGGAAGLVELGSRAHVITVKNADDWMVFKGSRGWAKVKEVHHPGYKGDPYVERAIAKTDLGEFTASIVGAAYAAMFLRSVRA